MAAEELEDVHRLDAKLKSMKAELKAAVLGTGSVGASSGGLGLAGRSPGSHAWIYHVQATGNGE
jgi:hypothetical protein